MQATGTDRSGVVHTLAACACELNTSIFQHPYQAPLGTLLTFDKGGRIGPGASSRDPNRTHNSCYHGETLVGGTRGRLSRMCPIGICLN